MSTTVTVTFTDSQKKAMDFWVVNTQDFLDNFAHDTARRATDELVSLLVTHCNENEIAMAVGKDAQITQAYELGVVTTAVLRNAAAEALPE